jgi:nitrogen fixation/metabolism regulation signal transduction histidine kinase
MLPDQAVAAAGLGPEKLKAKYEELEAKNKRQNDSILRQAATITRMQSQFDDITKMPDETRAQLLNQAKSLLRRPVQVTKPPVAG